MATITLWHLARSPPSWAVRIVADILGLKVELKEIDFVNMEHKSPEFLKINRMGTFPVIKDGDTYIPESHTIIKYLVNKYGKEEHKKLYPSDRLLQAAVDEVNFYDAGVAFIRLRLIALPAVSGGFVGLSPKMIEDTEEVYKTIDSYLEGRNYVALNEFSVADISLGTTTFSLHGFHPVDKTKFPRTAAWVERLRAMPVFQKIVLPGSEALTGFIKSKWEANKAKK